MLPNGRQQTINKMTKAEIIDAAFKVWGRKLYRNTSLNDLARELKVSKQALYRHFKDKQALINGMTGYFLDDFAGFIRQGFEQAQNGDSGSRIIIIIRAFIEYFARNVYALAFSLINIMGQKRGASVLEQLEERGVDMKTVYRILKREYAAKPALMQLIFSTLVFFMAHFHKTMESFSKTPSEPQIKKIIADIDEVITYGLRLSRTEIAALDFAALERHIDIGTIEDNPLLKAVALAVAEAGPWNASMDMVARHSGLSKSSLYGHFKNKKDMLRQLFLTEFDRILAFSTQGIKQSSVSLEQLYLGIFSIAAYLRSRPEILVAMDWIRTRKLDLGPPGKKPVYKRLFEGIEIELQQIGDDSSADERRQLMYHWILFLVISTLMRREREESLGKISNEDIRILFRFIALGLNGFKQNE
jgi:AcrR family transcriptional regulator